MADKSENVAYRLFMAGSRTKKGLKSKKPAPAPKGAVSDKAAEPSSFSGALSKLFQ